MYTTKKTTATTTNMKDMLPVEKKKVATTVDDMGMATTAAVKTKEMVKRE